VGAVVDPAAWGAPPQFGQPEGTRQRIKISGAVDEHHVEIARRDGFRAFQFIRELELFVITGCSVTMVTS